MSELNMKDLWQIQTQNDIYTSIALLSDGEMAVGYRDGDIALIPSTCALLKEGNEWKSNANSILNGHVESITCLFAPETDSKPYLLSGDASGVVILWNFKYSQC